MGWEFAALLVAALVANMSLGLWQNRAYLRDVNAMARDHAGPERRLISGRAKGRLRGVVVVLVVDTAAKQVVAAKTMTGATSFSRLKPAPHLVGSLDGVLERADSKQLADAITNAFLMLPTSGGTAAAAAPRTPSGRIKIQAPHRTESK